MVERPHAILQGWHSIRRAHHLLRYSFQFHVYTVLASNFCDVVSANPKTSALYLQSQQSKSPTKVLAHLSTFEISVTEFISSSSSLQFNVVYRDEVIIARLQHCWRGRGLPILVMPLAIVPKIPHQRIFLLSEPNVPRTFVVDCSLSGKSKKSQTTFVDQRLYVYRSMHGDNRRVSLQFFFLMKLASTEMQDHACTCLSVSRVF